MSPDQVIRAALWTVTSVAGIVGSFVWAQIDGSEPATLWLGAAGLVSLVGLVIKLVSDYRATSELIDDYRTALDDERTENHRLRGQLNDRRDPS